MVHFAVLVTHASDAIEGKTRKKQAKRITPNKVHPSSSILQLLIGRNLGLCFGRKSVIYSPS